MNDLLEKILTRRPEKAIASRAARLEPVESSRLEPRIVPSADVLTYHNDNARTGANLNETLLTPSNVNASDFGKVGQLAVDGQVYAQPLVESGVAIPGQGVRNVLVVATEHDSVYAFDADTLAPLWHDSFLDPTVGATTVPTSAGADITPEIGITGTPVIDPTTNTIYVVAVTKELNPYGALIYVQRLHALDVATGQEKFGGPVEIQASVPGTGVASVGGIVSFDPQLGNQRPALLLLNGVVYIAWASHADANTTRGWVLGYDAQTLQEVAAFSTEPNGNLGTVWMSGDGLAADAAGNLYLSTGNGPFDANTGGADYGDSVLKLSTTNSLAVADYFTPYNQQALNDNDVDLGSGGVVLLPDQGGGSPPLLVAAGKQGTIYLINRNNLGQFDPGMDHVVQELAGELGGAFDTPAYFNGMLYYAASGDYGNNPLKAFSLQNGLLSSAPISGGFVYGYPGSTPSVSANGTTNGIVWTLDNSAYASGGPAILRAYPADDITHELFDSTQDAARDQGGPAIKFTVPTVVNGKVYVGGGGTVTVYGLLNPSGPPPAPTSSANSVSSDTQTSGNWQGVYGADGTDLAGASPALPAYAQVSVDGAGTFIWSDTTADTRALPTPSASGRLAAAWYAANSFDIDLNISDGKSHQVTLYALDWDGANTRSEQVDLIDAATGTVLDSRVLTSFSGGEYLSWQVSGHVLIRVTNLNPASNAVVSGLFFGTAPKASTTYVSSDTQTSGNWQGAYGAEGTDLAGASPALPAYAQVSVHGAGTFIWSATTADTRAVQAPSASGRLAAAWYAADSFDIDLNISDGMSHLVSLYALDWDWLGARKEQFDLIDAATGAVLDSRVLTSFSGGEYLSWQVSGHVLIRVTNLNPGSNAVVSGLFFGTAKAATTYASSDFQISGNWQGVYGADGTDLAGASPALPAYAQVSVDGAGTFIWSDTTADTRALPTPSASGRLAAAWYAADSFDIDLNINDGKSHQITLYALDWDGANTRSEQVDLIDAATGTVLDSRVLTSFSGGEYLSWQVSGHVLIRVTNLNPAMNAVVSGLFFG